MEKFHGCMILLLFAGKLSRLYSNLKHLIITKKNFTGKLSRLETDPGKPRKFSTVNDLHYTVVQLLSLIFFKISQLIDIIHGTGLGTNHVRQLVVYIL